MRQVAISVFSVLLLSFFAVAAFIFSKFIAIELVNVDGELAVYQANLLLFIIVLSLFYVILMYFGRRHLIFERMLDGIFSQWRRKYLRAQELVTIAAIFLGVLGLFRIFNAIAGLDFVTNGEAITVLISAALFMERLSLYKVSRRDGD